MNQRPIRVFVFPERPDSLLVIAPEGASELKLPALSVPFEKGPVAYALGTAGIEARVVETVPGRWSHVMQRAAKDERAERAQQDRLRQAKEAAILKGSAVAEVRERAEAITRKQLVDEEIARLKGQIKEARSKAHTRGVYMDPDRFRRMERRLEELKLESQAIQARLGELKQAEKEANKKLRREETERFVAAARRLLDAETFEEILTASQEDDEDEEAHETEAQAA